MKLKTIILTLAGVIALSAPAMALDIQPRLGKQVLDSYYLAGKNIALLRHKAVTTRMSRDARPAVTKVRAKVR